jgi:hypothetical protein
MTEPITARSGFDASTWRSAPVFGGHCATPADVESADAVFALADTFNGRPMALDKPAPVIWYADDEEFAALLVQAEAHETEEEGPLEFLGLLLPSGGTAVVFAEDVEFVAPGDPVWLALLEADRPGNEAPEDDSAAWADLNWQEDEEEADWRVNRMA